MKRLLSRVLCVVFVLALLATSCGGGSDSSSEPAASPDPAPAADPAPASPDPAPEPAASSDDGSSEDDGSSSNTSAEELYQDIENGSIEPVFGGELIAGIEAGGSSWSTVGAMDAQTIRMAGAMSDPLIYVTDDGGWAPGLAESMTPNEDATVWTMVMRPDVRFHDGVALTAEAVVANVEAFKASPTVGFVYQRLDEVVAIDELTLEFRMNGPWGAFPYTLVAQAGYMVSPETIGVADSYVSTGAFKFDTWDPADGLRIVRNDDWWGAGDEGLPYLDSIRFKVLVEQSAREAALETGDIDIYHAPGDQAILRFDADPDFVYWSSSGGANEGMIILNTTSAPLDDVRVRRALAHATDRDLIIDAFRSGLTEPANTFIEPSNRFWVDTDDLYPGFDMAAAQGLIAEYEAENGDATVVLHTLEISAVTEVAEVVAALWQQAGVDVEIQSVAVGGPEVSMVIGDQFQAVMWFQFSAADPDGTYPFVHSSMGILNWSNFADAQLDEGLDIGRASLDEAERAAGYALAQERMASEVPIIYLDHLTGVEGLVSKPTVHDVYSQARDADAPAPAPVTGGSFHSYHQIWIG